ncbi:Disease resistance protein SUMM2 [Citrus sinensis]|uniref:Uncharacterized protein n=1 Tax=Citrus clementina TaxID=85681 RepID=V4SNG0_CITCL|nr:disease resistance protein SUMM2 [Citrus x clementina]XP_006465371.2 disease resistance protein SUMM2-like [Citrus sinensis]ESR40450.1 hypothetical protein CICLE_v10024846mg [Citrus x clementina]KAH9666561.1 Disease resistance protein SUMM2 [Citrus sinensis]
MGNLLSSFLSSPESFRSILSYVGGEAKYVWALQVNLDALQAELDKLIRTKDDLLNKVELVEQQQPRARRTNQVKGWLQRVQETVTKAVDLQNVRDQELDRLCLGGFCSKDLASSYYFGKKVVTLTEQVILLKNERGEIKDIAEMVPEDAAVELALERTVVGQESMLDQVWRCITDQEKNRGIIGLYGTGGVGKTTLLKQVNNKFCIEQRQHHFDVVIWGVVSREPKLDKIQDAIGKRIGLSAESWKDKSLEEKALDISNILSRKKFVLLLDDIWQPIDLTELGIPLQSLNVSSKVVFTTRSLNVCGSMEADEKIEVKYLVHDEAWRLFQEKVGEATLRCHSDILELAQTLARECCGLPLALKTIGRAMAYKKNPDEWKYAIKVLSTSPEKFPGMEENVFARLKFSYDSLPNYIIRSCFLYCSLFPEDYEVYKGDLIDYWTSEGFVDAFDEGYTIISDLLRACLMEEVNDNHVKMHDVIRDMALWIACKIDKEEENFLVHAGALLTEAPKIKDWEGFKRISLMENNITSLSAIPNCPHLRTLVLYRNRISMITDGFFQFMPSLKVLNLGFNIFLNKLPSGLSSLISLEHLDLSFTVIRELPEEMKALVNLRYLNLEYVYLNRLPLQLLCNFTKLQALRMLGCSNYSGEEEDRVFFKDAEPFMKELLCLENLDLLSFTFDSWHAFETFLTFQKLLSCTESLELTKLYTPMSLNVLPLAYMKHLKNFLIQNCAFEELKIENAVEIQNLVQRGFRSLHTVFISDCSRLKELTWLVFAPNLKNIDVQNCNNMEEIISPGKLSEASEIKERQNFLAELEFLCLKDLENLESIYFDPLPFPQLKEIEVTGCPKLKKLPLDSTRAMGHKIVVKGNIEWWVELQWEDRVTQRVFSTCFDPMEIVF